jgi:hypothetical protein
LGTEEDIAKEKSHFSFLARVLDILQNLAEDKRSSMSIA